MCADYQDYDKWLEKSSIEKQTSASDFAVDKTYDVDKSTVTIPAKYIADAINQSNNGDKKIISGLRMKKLRIEGNLHLENFSVPFPIHFIQCKFTGVLYIWRVSAKTFSFVGSKLHKGADARTSEFDGHVLMREGFVSDGPILLRDCTIKGTLDCSESSFLYDGISPSELKSDAEGDAFGFSRGSATALYWRKLESQPVGKINFRDAYVKSFVHNLDSDERLKSWPRKGNLIIDGFQYNRIDHVDFGKAISWLNLQPSPTPSSFAALARAFARDNLREDAENALIERKKIEINSIENTVIRIVQKFFYFLIGYGKQPERALFFLLIIMLSHFLSVSVLSNNNKFQPAIATSLLEPCFLGTGPECKKNISDWRRIEISGDTPEYRYVPKIYPEISPVQYTIESFIPMIDFSQRRYWEPISSACKVMLSFLAAFGIFLGGVFVGGISGVLTPRLSQL